MKTKKQLIVELVLNEAQRLSKNPLTVKQQNGLKGFVENRLDTHGKYGYMFQTVSSYKREFIPVSEIETIATYALNNNFVKMI